jgi:hypothetical protein
MKEALIVIGLLVVATLVAYPCKVLDEADRASTKADEQRRKNDVEEDPSLLNQ